MSELRLAILRAAKSIPGGVESVAPMISTPERRVNPQVLRNQLIGNERHHLSIDTAELIIDVTDSDELVHAAARQRGGVFVKLPDPSMPASDLAVLELVTHVWRANGDVGRAVDETLADGRVELGELAAVRQAIYRTQQAMTAMLQRMESMAE